MSQESLDGNLWESAQTLSVKTLVLLLALLASALVVRLANFPQHSECRDVDENGYMFGGLVLLEGIQPGYKASGAGPMTWTTWTYAAAKSAKDYFTTERSAPFALRPYLAINHALFDIYSDMTPLHRFLLIEQLIVSLVGCYFAFRLGLLRAGWPGALLLGGAVALSPLFVDYVATTRPYADAWAFSIIAIAYAANGASRYRPMIAGVLFGMAVSSRIDMLSLFPLLWWEFYNRDGRAQLIHRLFIVTVAALITTLILAPWLTTGFIGNVRMIMSYRVVGNRTDLTRLDTLRSLMWKLAFGPLVILIIAGFLMLLVQRCYKFAAPIFFALLLLVSAFAGAQAEPRYQGAMMIALIVVSALALGPMFRFNRKWAAAVALGILVLPIYQTVRLIGFWRARYMPSDEIAWIEQHIPAGTAVYSQADMRMVLPTAESADRIWSELMSLDAAKRKLERGLAQLNSSATTLPRAFSEENLVLDRSNTRRFYILGSPFQRQRPRYDLRIYSFSPVFGTQNVVSEFAKSGGVIIWGLNKQPPPALGQPIKSWTKPGGIGRFIFVSPDLAAKLK
ncbi:MAG TPA: hypothetical protein VF669_01950 [Tepidisphaeraceae bacterium]|jgi:hypothetical protein